jgi:hypothetical protein
MKISIIKITNNNLNDLKDFITNLKGKIFKNVTISYFGDNFVFVQENVNIEISKKNQWIKIEILNDKYNKIFISFDKIKFIKLDKTNNLIDFSLNDLFYPITIDSEEIFEVFSDLLYLD